ncbi:outer membrane protein assembly factor BamA [candidate division GN15 bacterium]|nr:outer membrane protein assembly factor BamA [candidate division GN15 bacterium]
MRLGAGKALLYICLTLLILSSGLLAQENPRVVKIEVEGNRIATPSLILGVAAIDLGSPLTPNVIQESIHRLYSLGIFRDVKIEAREVTGGIEVYVVVDELPKLTALTFEGNDKFSDEDLRDELSLGVGGYISPYLVYEKRQQIKTMYGNKGYFQASVTPELSYNADSTEASLNYKVNERSKVKVENVVMTGNRQVEAGDLIGKMRNRKRGFLRSSDFAQEEYDEDLEKVIAEYHKRGFIDAYLIDDSISIDSSRNRMTIYLDVYEGPQYYFGNVDFAGNEVLPDEALEDRLKYDQGDVFNAEKYEESLFELYTAYQEIGHLHIRLNDQRTTRNDSILDITYTIGEGLPSKINMVRIVGNTKTKDHVIRREIKMLPGMTFNRSLLIRSVRDVMALNYFANVEPVPVDLPSGDVDLEFRIEEKQTGQVSAGAGYNSQDKLVGTVGMGIPNFRGMGQNLSFNIEFGSNRNSFSVSFTEPWMFGHPTLLGTDLYSINRNWFDDYTEARQGGSIRLGRRLRWPDNYFRVFAAYRLERTRFNDFDDAYVAQNSFNLYDWVESNGLAGWQTGQTIDSAGVDTIPADTRTVTDLGPYPGSILEYDEKWNSASRLSLTIVRDSRNLPEFATEGSRISYTFEQTGGPLGGFWEYQKHQVEIAKFIPIWRNIALAAKVEFGGIRAPKGDNRILISDRYTPGGTAYDGIVRGYDDGALTPDSIITQGDTIKYFSDPSADPATAEPDSVIYPGTFRTRVRGNYMLVTNWELQVPILPQQLYALAFFDAGSSWLRHDDIRLDLYKSVGIGFRLLVPGIGTIGFDFGYPLDKFRDEEQSWKPHFQVGTTFR